MPRIHRIILTAIALVAVVVLASCTADTEPATNVTDTTATLNGKIKCNTGDGSGEWWWEVGPSGSFNRVGNRNPFDCQGNASNTVPIVFNATGLTPSTNYQFRLCQWTSAQQANTVCVDSNGTVFGPSSPPSNVVYDTFLTQDPPPPAGCTLNATTANFQSTYNSAPANAVICLAAGNYGTFTGSQRSSLVTIKPGSGVAKSAVTMEFLANPASNITIQGMTLTDIDLRDSRSKNLTFKDNQVNGKTTVRTGEITNANVVFDGNNHFWNPTNPQQEARFWLPDQTAAGSGVTIKNSVFDGGLSDGIQNGSKGTKILNNEFRNIPSGSAGGVHADAIQLYGSSNTEIDGNWFHNLSSGVGIIMAPDGLDHEIITDNVFGPNDGGRPFIDIFSDDSSQIVHNTFVTGNCEFNQTCGRISLGSKSEDDAGFGTIIKDNILQGIGNGGGPATWTATSNLITPPLPTYVGPTTSYAGFKLAAGSAGKGAASDGLDLGARIP